MIDSRSFPHFLGSVLCPSLSLITPTERLTSLTFHLQPSLLPNIYVIALCVSVAFSLLHSPCSCFAYTLCLILISWVSKHLIHLPQIYQLWNYSKFPKYYLSENCEKPVLAHNSVTSYVHLTEDWDPISLLNPLQGVSASWHLLLPSFVIYGVVLFWDEKVERWIALP